ncbi:uncharacterized protein DS421_5g135440 [Arachis hypogaea]|nr:uncharacterized protein DS421_5g135440 [Arachis hypogaea]
MVPAEAETKEKCRKNAINRSKQLYTHTGGLKSFAPRMEEEYEEKGEELVEESYGSKCTKKRWWKSSLIMFYKGKEKAYNITHQISMTLRVAEVFILLMKCGFTRTDRYYMTIQWGYSGRP